MKIQPSVDRADLPGLLEARGLVPSTLHTAPVASVVVDVGPDRTTEDEMFQALRATTRRRVRQAHEHGVTVRAGSGDDLPVLQGAIEATARRQGFSPYPADYYRRIWAWPDAPTSPILGDQPGGGLRGVQSIQGPHHPGGAQAGQQVAAGAFAATERRTPSVGVSELGLARGGGSRR